MSTARSSCSNAAMDGSMIDGGTRMGVGPANSLTVEEKTVVCTDALWFWIVHRPPVTYTLPLAVTHDADDRGALNNAGSPRGVPSDRATSLWRDHVPVTVHSSGVLAPVGAASTSSRCSVCRLDDCVPPACVPPNTSKSPPTPVAQWLYLACGGGPDTADRVILDHVHVLVSSAKQSLHAPAADFPPNTSAMGAVLPLGRRAVNDDCMRPDGRVPRVSGIHHVYVLTSKTATSFNSCMDGPHPPNTNIAAMLSGNGTPPCGGHASCVWQSITTWAEVAAWCSRVGGYHAAAVRVRCERHIPVDTSLDSSNTWTVSSNDPWAVPFCLR